ncbi:DUF397 domain-containing protein [Streptomyces sp. MUM 203J]|uniref:DUF397 domain-containing protein n=1 Tax=Streptomyces sp. MUM 203J TaxID=2791990 RepID=UPI001F03C794|nr:DUF397 domain-containing protein [Streptomyces sp. MUM 203J]MCH0541800.1 DUF397 domain-containing protein [Streptomyces sp. MUM 203J]
MPVYQWRKSSYSGDGSNCVCLAVAADGTVRLRDSKVPGTVTACSPVAFGRFLGALVDGQFECGVDRVGS